MNISPHFTLEELTASNIASRRDISNEPDNDCLDNLKRLAKHLEDVRTVLNKPIVISSGYRSPGVNSLVGGSPNSQHMYGSAADFRVPGMTPDEVMRAIIAAGLPYDQLILEFNAWVHYSIPNVSGRPWRSQALIIDKNGTRPYPVEGVAKTKKPRGLLCLFQS